MPTYVLAGSHSSVAPMSGSGVSGYTPAQVRHAYGFDQISFNGTAGDGTGTTIAIVDAYDDPNVASDLHQFDQQFGLADPTFTKVNQTGGSSMPTADAGWSQEIALDVEWAHAIASKANILLVEASSNSMSDLLTAVQYAAKQPGVDVVSMSWGGGESSSETSWDSSFVTPAGHTGVVFVASSGDNGSPVSYPAVSPNVLSVGGTTLTLGTSNTYGSESAWSGSGGGISGYEAQPSYQKGVVTQSSTARTNPDVAYDADPNTGFPVYDSYNTSTPWGQIGGTSDAAPQWAALVAIADQGRAQAGATPLNGSSLLSMVYQLPASDFHDVTTGSSTSSTGGPSYSAGPGYDLATGRGTPIANLVVNGLVGTTTTTSATHFSVTPAATTTTAGAALSVTVTALDANNHAVSGYTGTVHFTSSDTAAGLPANYSFTSADAGQHTFTVTLHTVGQQTVTVADVASSSLSGTSTSIIVTAGAVAGFRVSGFASPVTAGTASTFTVTAVDGSGNAVRTYSGTVHFTSTDTHAVLPANATLSNGTGQFSATLKTAGSQSITATDVATGVTGTQSGITVNPAAATHLVFGVQPTTAQAGVAISPAVTVQLLDAYNNVVTTDNTDQVSLALANNPTGATVSGGTVTVTHGVATFSNLSVNKAGTGYTLRATSGSLTGATSNSFTVTAPPSATTVETFDNGLGNYYYVGYDYPAFYTESYAAHDGAYGLDNVANSDWIFRNDAAATVHTGENISVWVQFPSAASGRAYFGFGASANGTLSLVAAPNTNQLMLQDNAGYGFSSVAAVSQSYQADHWYRLEVDWGTTGTIAGKLFDSNGTTLLATVTGVDTSVTSGGIAFRGTSANDVYWDTVTVAPAASSSAASPAIEAAWIGNIAWSRQQDHGAQPWSRGSSTLASASSWLASRAATASSTHHAGLELSWTDHGPAQTSEVDHLFALWAQFDPFKRA